MKNGQLKPAYNVQISTNNQFIASYSIHQKTTDTNTLIPHLEQHEKDFGQKPDSITADAGYGSEENYQALEDKNIPAHVSTTNLTGQQNKTIRDKKPFSADKLYYNRDKDCCYCPMGQPINKIGPATKTTSARFKQQLTYTRQRTAMVVR